MSRRFPDTVIRRRHADATFNVYGELIDVAPTETTIRASVQPLKVEDVDFEGGAQFQSKLKVYVPQEDALRAAFEDALADEVVVDGETFTVVESQSWPRSHTKAILERSAVTGS